MFSSAENICAFDWKLMQQLDGDGVVIGNFCGLPRGEAENLMKNSRHNQFRTPQNNCRNLLNYIRISISFSIDAFLG
jgi:hypothetical protein